MQDCDHVLRFRETAFETLDRLRRERNFRDEHDGSLAPRQRELDRLQINFRFSAPGHAVQQESVSHFRRGQRFLDRGSAAVCSAFSARFVVAMNCSSACGSRCTASSRISMNPRFSSARNV